MFLARELRTWRKCKPHCSSMYFFWQYVPQLCCDYWFHRTTGDSMFRNSVATVDSTMHRVVIVIESSYGPKKNCTHLFEVKFYRVDNECKQSNSWKFGRCALTLRNSPRHQSQHFKRSTVIIINNNNTIIFIETRLPDTIDKIIIYRWLG